MKILLIDDQPDQRLENIKEAIKTFENFQIECLKEVIDSSTIKQKIQDIDLIILDWYFPPNYPQGEDILNLIRQSGFTGPILIYTVGFGKFDIYLGEGKADDYFNEYFGIEALADTIKRLITNITNKKEGTSEKVLKLSINDNKFIYYSSFEHMKKHFYHSQSTNNSISNSEKDKSRKKAIFVTCEWDEDNGEAKQGVMGQVIRKIEKLAEPDIPVLILGETGTGKELVAKLLHFHHKNKGKRYGFNDSKGTRKDYFMALNCGAFTETGTLNVELFGSLPGAFTDATEKAGIFEQVTEYDKDGNALYGGTVFLDEVALMGLSTQAILLRVLQENNVYRMGHDERKVDGPKKVMIENRKIESRLFGKIPVKFRLVAATNEDLFEKTKRGNFRVDLFYRIARAIITLPPLRNRSLEDFNLLFQFFLHHFNEKYGRNVNLKNEGGYVISPSRDLIAYLWASYPWKGNVRELEGLVETIVAFSEPSNSEPLSLKDIPEFHWKRQEI